MITDSLLKLPVTWLRNQFWKYTMEAPKDSKHTTSNTEFIKYINEQISKKGLTVWKKGNNDQELE